MIFKEMPIRMTTLFTDWITDIPQVQYTGYSFSDCLSNFLHNKAFKAKYREVEVCTMHSKVKQSKEK